MREKLITFWEKAKSAWTVVKTCVNDTLNTAFPKTEKKYIFYGFFGFVEILLLYLVLIFDMGIWINDCSPWGMVAGYFQAHKGFPLGWILLLCGGFAFGIFAHLYFRVNGNTGRGFSISDSNVYGSAREINTEELQRVADIVPKEAAMGTILGQLDQSETQLITAKSQFNFNGNIAVFGPPGSGKTFCFVLPTIVQAIRRRESVICTDTKGELWAKTSHLARLHGYTVRRIDLRNPAVSDGWNVLKELRWDDMRALIAAQIVMKNTGNEKDIHASAEESLFRAVCLYVERSDMVPPEQKNLYHVLELLLEGIAALDKRFEELRYHRDDRLRPAYDAYANFIQGSANLRGNVITNLTNRLQVISSPPVRRMTSVEDVDLTLPGKQPCIYYLCVSDQHETMKFVANLFYSFSFLNLGDFADSQPDLKLPVPVTFLMEEFCNLGEVPNISKYLSTCRSRRIDIMLIVQSLGQLRDIYGDNQTLVLLGNCATHVCIGYNDQDTADYFCWRSGEATVDVRTEHHSVGESPIPLGRGYATGDGRRNIYTAHELMTLDFGKVYLVWQRCNALIADTFGINRHPAYMAGEMPLTDANVHIPLENIEARAYLRAKEEQRIMDYEEWVAKGGNPWPYCTVPVPETTGECTNTPIPPVMPYGDLEKEALAHSEQARSTKGMKSKISAFDTFDVYAELGLEYWGTDDYNSAEDSTEDSVVAESDYREDTDYDESVEDEDAAEDDDSTEDDDDVTDEEYEKEVVQQPTKKTRNRSDLIGNPGQQWSARQQPPNRGNPNIHPTHGSHGLRLDNLGNEKE